ncbi:MAG: AAA family ATPase [Thermodesulfobacteriota bacterium]|nr:AAA family ATPase [Thermodesulfobacteriota bacterium]
MYADFYNLKEQPFDLTPSPRFLYLGEVHKEALAVLTYGVVERKGFVLLTGETGTGKSTMVHALLANLDKDVKYVYLTNPLLSADDFMRYLALTAFDKTFKVESKAEFLIAFEHFLRETLKHKRNFVLIVDEAQEVSLELLEEVRLLSNMGTAEKKLVNIFLVGQPELNEKLNEPRCRALLQRIGTRYHMNPLNLKATQEYIAAALQMAGTKNPERILPNSVVKAIHQYSEGYPRMINILADNVLLLAYSRGQKKITPSMVRECHDELRPDASSSPSGFEGLKQQERRKTAAPKVGRPLKWAAILFIITALVALSVSPHGRKVVQRLTQLIPVRYVPTPNEGGQDQTPVQNRVIRRVKDEPRVVSVPVREVSVGAVAVSEREKTTALTSSAPISRRDSVQDHHKAPKTTLVVKRGDTFSKLATAVYGRAEEDILELVHTHNAHIKDMNYIEVGQEIVFPPLPVASGK